MDTRRHPGGALHDLLRADRAAFVNEQGQAVVHGQPAPERVKDPVRRAESARRAGRQGARAVITTLGGAGAIITDTGGITAAVPAIPAAVRDTTGAGDAFVASRFLVCWWYKLADHPDLRRRPFHGAPHGALARDWSGSC
ncbi:PfkB family carbohydrate kinase [Streptomyces sp. NPDC002676]